jgi:hypothetical protein
MCNPLAPLGDPCGCAARFPAGLTSQRREGKTT